ncbi:hypothetical protein A2332_00325 [Candidatus Uhrbacteria bacterium RIFOXYB2_FULL_41_18]|nr:MAG: hypothetical protein A2332_00325 [Candidatus Uhrbacteria bacterium RIFOXYB2_FULL_41_18]
MNVFFDAVIFFYLIAIGAFIIELVTSWKEVTQKRIRACLGILFFFSWLVIFYGSFVEPKFLRVTEEKIFLSQEPTQTIDLLVIGDFHVGPYRKSAWIEKVVQEANTLSPDVIVLVGDYIYNHSSQMKENNALALLEAPLGVHAITGNHDYIDQHLEMIVDFLQQAGIQVLENTSVNLSLNDKNVTLAGMSDLWFDGDLEETLEGVTPEETVILLSHNPDVVLDLQYKQVDLVISGHTHGGQIRLPWIGSVAKIPDLLGRTYDLGLFDYKGLPLFITGGVGETGPRARLFNPPEMNLLHVSF